MTSLQCFGQLVRKELTLFVHAYPGKFVDNLIIVMTFVVVFGFFMPQFGLQSGYSAFITMGMIASTGFWDIIQRVSDLIGDITGDRKISYLLTLPLPASMVFSSIAVGWALCSALLSISFLPVAKLVLGSAWPLRDINFLGLVLMFPTINLFFGFFALWLSALIKSSQGISMIWIRVVTPLYTFGGFWYPWKTMYDISPILGIVNLANPLVHVMDGIRAVTLGQQGFLSWPVSLLVLWAFTAFCGWDATRRLKRTLDCV